MLQVLTTIQIDQTFKMGYFTNNANGEKYNNVTIDKYNNKNDINPNSDSCKFMSILLENSFEYSVEKSWDNLSQIAKISIPSKTRKLKFIETDINFPDTDANNNINNPFPGTGKVQQTIDLTKDYVSLGVKKIGDKYTTFAGLKDGTGKVLPNQDLAGIDQNDVGLKLNPIISLGDIVYIKRLYLTLNNKTNTQTRLTSNIDTYFLNDNGSISANSVDEMDSRYQLYRGYVTKIDVDNEGTTHIECEDSTYYLNRARVPNKIYSSSFGTHSTPSDKSLLNLIKQNPNFYSNPKGNSINTILNDMLGDPCILSGQQIICGSTQSGIQNITELPAPIFKFSESDNNGFVSILNKPLALVNKKYIIYSHGLTFDKNIDTQIGDWNLDNATIGGFLEKVKNESEIPSYIVNEPSNQQLRLYCSTFTYKDYNTDKMSKENNRVNFANGKTTNRPKSQYHIFTSNYDIISSNLNWNDVTDSPVGFIIKSDYKTVTDLKTKKGKNRKKIETLSFSNNKGFSTVYSFKYHSTSATYGSKKNAKGADILEDSDLKSLKDDMQHNGEEQLKKIHYTGFAPGSSFTTFGYPYIEFGDVVTILDKNFPERSGTYYVKKVLTTFNFNGALQQEIFIDYRIADPVPIFPYIDKNGKEQSGLINANPAPTTNF